MGIMRRLIDWFVTMRGFNKTPAVQRQLLSSAVFEIDGLKLAYDQWSRTLPLDKKRSLVLTSMVVLDDETLCWHVVGRIAKPLTRVYKRYDQWLVADRTHLRAAITSEIDRLQLSDREFTSFTAVSGLHCTSPLTPAEASYVRHLNRRALKSLKIAL